MKKNNKKGFTLVELVIVVAVMAILVAVAIPTVKSITGTATSAVNETNARTIESTIKLWEAECVSGSTTAAANLSTALTNAKLGIEEGSFAYNITNGTVEPITTDDPAASGEITITYASGAVTLSAERTKAEVVAAG